MKNQTTQYSCAGCALAAIILVALYVGLAYVSMLAWNVVAMPFHWPILSYPTVLAVFFLLWVLGIVVRLVVK